MLILNITNHLEMVEGGDFKTSYVDIKQQFYVPPQHQKKDFKTSYVDIKRLATIFPRRLTSFQNIIC